MTYKDKTFCPHEINPDCKKRLICHRVMGQEAEKIVAEKGYVVSYFADKPECHEVEN